MRNLFAGVALLVVMSAANAQTLSTPVLTFDSSDATALPFRLVSQSDTSTEIELDGLTARMQGSVFSPANGDLDTLMLTAVQTFNLTVNPAYELTSFFLITEFALTVYPGSSYALAEVNYDMRLTKPGSPFNQSASYMAKNNGATQASLFVYASNAYMTMPNQMPLTVDLRATLNANATEWISSEASIAAQRTYFIFNTARVTPVPEPATWLLLLSGLGVCLRRMRSAS